MWLTMEPQSDRLLNSPSDGVCQCVKECKTITLTFSDGSRFGKRETMVKPDGPK